MIATPDTVHGTGGRHRVVAIGSGFGGLTATKALKHAQVNITDALVFLTRITAQGTSHLIYQRPYGLRSSQRPQPLQPLLACSSRYMSPLSVSPRKLLKYADTTKHTWIHSTAEGQCVAAQTRKVVLSCVRTPGSTRSASALPGQLNPAGSHRPFVDNRCAQRRWPFAGAREQRRG